MPLFGRQRPDARARAVRYQPRGKFAKIEAEPVSLVAAAAEIRQARERKGATAVMPLQQWQSRSLGYYHMLGEAWNPAQFISTAMSKMRFYPARLDDDGQAEEITAADEPELVDAVAILQKVAPKWGLLLWMIGEGRLCQFRDPDDDPADPVRWDFFSPQEIKLTDGNRKIERSPFGTGSKMMYTNISEMEGAEEPAPGQMRTWRFWRPDPQNSELADSPVRAVLDQYEQLWWLTMSERADLQNRIADNGILLIPSELDWEPPAGRDATATEEDPNDGTLMEYIGEAAMEAIGDPGSASAAVPVGVVGKGEYLDQMRILHTHEGAQAMVFVSQREESIVNRIAQSLPLPKEAITGMSGANHWNAWKIEDEKWQLTEPWVTMFALDATAVFLLPWLQANGMDEGIFVAYDYSGLVGDPDKGATAIKLNAQGLLSGGATLNANGWGDGDEMTGEELAWWRAIALRDAALATGEPAPTDPAVGSDEQPPEEPASDEPPAGEAAALDVLKKQALAFADLRARANIGAMLRGRKRSCPDCFAGLENVTNELLLAHLDADSLAHLGVQAGALVERMSETFMAVAYELGYESFNSASQLAQWYLLTLHRPETLPDDIVERIGYRGAVR